MHDVRGNPRNLQKLDLKAVEAFYRKYYVPSNMTVVVVGDVDPVGVERVTRAAFQADQFGTAGTLAQPGPAAVYHH